MRSIGTWLLILGIGSFVLPLFGLQFKLLNAAGEGAPYIGLGAAVLGGLLLGVSFLMPPPSQQAE